MRKETRDVHKISDALINAKLAFGKYNALHRRNPQKFNCRFVLALSDNQVWADGLLVFYEIFRFLEENVSEDLLPNAFHRTEAFERDLAYYLGENWRRDYEIRDSVKMYLKHLHDVKNRSPILLLAYVYHLYMGLLSGGQILQKKRSLNLLGSRNNGGGDAVTHFENHTIAELKTIMRSLVDKLAISFDESTKILLIAESKMVFHLNNEIVRTVRGVNRVNIRKFGIVLVVVIGIFYLLKLK